MRMPRTTRTTFEQCPDQPVLCRVINGQHTYLASAHKPAVPSRPDLREPQIPDWRIIIPAPPHRPPVELRNFNFNVG